MTEQEPSCPLCEFSREGTSGLYRHLLVSHRKSELSKALLQATFGEETEMELGKRSGQ